MISSYVGSEGNEGKKKSLLFLDRSLKSSLYTVFLLKIQEFKKKATRFGKKVEFTSETQRCNSGWHVQVL